MGHWQCWCNWQLTINAHNTYQKPADVCSIAMNLKLDWQIFQRKWFAFIVGLCRAAKMHRWHCRSGGEGSQWSQWQTPGIFLASADWWKVSRPIKCCNSSNGFCRLMKLLFPRFRWMGMKWINFSNLKQCNRSFLLIWRNFSLKQQQKN